MSSEAILWKMILVLMQYSLNNDHQHHKWQQQNHGYNPQTARLRSSICLYPGKKAPKIISNSQIGMSRHFGFVYHDTNGLNHGPVWKTQSFLLKGICTDTVWQDFSGKGNMGKSYCNTVGRRFPIGNAYSYTVKKGYSHLCMWMTSNWLERNITLIRSGTYSIKKLSWENQHHSLIMKTWDALKDNVK